jgi:sugar phosphate isomerase/epimerase
VEPRATGQKEDFSMKISFSTLGCPQWGIDRILDAARSHGWEGVELRFYEGSLDLPQALGDFPGGPAEFRRRFDQAGVAICCVDSSIVLTADQDPSAEADAIMALATALGAPYVRVFGGDVPEGEPWDDCVARVAEKLRRLGHRAHARGLRVLLETHDAFSSGARVAELLDAAGDVGTGALWDLYHPWRTGESPSRTTQLIAARTYHVHVKDGDREGKQTLLGQGSLPLADLLRALHSAGYAGYASLEWEKAWIPDLADPEIAFPHAARYLADLFRQVGIPRG